MMLKRTLSIAVFTCLLAARQAGASAAPSLIGAWQCGESSLVFRTENVLVFNGEQMRYQRQRDVIRVQEAAGVTEYPYALSGGKLSIRFPDGMLLQCVKGGAGPAPGGGPGGGGGTTAQLRGMLCRWSGSSGMSGSYSSSTRVWFDGAGRFTYSSESSFSVDAGMGYGSGPRQGGTYRISGNVVHLTFSDGNRGTAQVKMRQNNGMITELMYNGQLYAAGLCE